jgi:hypothetical protein
MAWYDQGGASFDPVRGGIFIEDMSQIEEEVRQDNIE